METEIINQRVQETETTYNALLPNNNLASAIERAYNRQPDDPVTIHEFNNRRGSLSLSGTNIKNLEGIENFTSISSL